ncbi:uncharacterized protein LOC110058441 isoform X2 [Orbicella faveolata]|uniref:uncharacterized protein LOC110058441 isoform X1 n=1 Tax=Orbicella faveolata TaxID=48498 RepID=UPI0009E26556|nr:uncharacterized protein LOC110058441 isoform X1 [Orbicella faveolata]XP_020620752.1 uncharacterized protein LOC110058441 isoform X2 [Orbicella faveolata]
MKSLCVLAFLLCLSVVKPVTYEYLGCFKDRDPHSLPVMIADFRQEPGFDWSNLKKTIQACAEKAMEQKMEYFALQFYGQCWSGPNAGETYARDGPSSRCYKGVGRERVNAVYRVTDLPA